MSIECDSIAHIEDLDAHGLEDSTIACMMSKILLPHYFLVLPELRGCRSCGLGMYFVDELIVHFMLPQGRGRSDIASGGWSLVSPPEVQVSACKLKFEYQSCIP
jgi:hypothetical protein